MTLLITVFAAVIATVVWYSSERARKMKISILCYLYWGASVMWLVDAIYEYAELRAAYFTPDLADMRNDLFLGLAAAALAMVIWVIVFLVKDPDGVLKNAMIKSKKK